MRHIAYKIARRLHINKLYFIKNDLITSLNKLKIIFSHKRTSLLKKITNASQTVLFGQKKLSVIFESYFVNLMFES